MDTRGIMGALFHHKQQPHTMERYSKPRCRCERCSCQRPRTPELDWCVKLMVADALIHRPGIHQIHSVHSERIHIVFHERLLAAGSLAQRHRGVSKALNRPSRSV